MSLQELTAKIKDTDQHIVSVFLRYGHFLHRITLALLFIWFGLLKPFGHKTTTSLVAETVYWGDPYVVVPLLGWWEVAIGICLIYRPLIRVGLLLLLIRLPGVLLAFFMLPEVTFLQVAGAKSAVFLPFIPTTAGQYLIKDLVILFAAIAIGGSVREESTPEMLQ